MKRVDITPEAYNDLEELKEHLDEEFGVETEKKILKAIFRDLKRLKKYPETDIRLFERFGIVTDYKCIYTNKNYAFYRIEGDIIKIIRIIDQRRDFLYVLFGIHMTESNEEDD
ncbi:MAG: type II toxin-antitoxin system RelE/ParE family toxin [Lachnospiraceae bacterium]|nr:type II toxin-antitoxin system RelE/ParE family toxin [Lachnospiraceae bacterium]